MVWGLSQKERDAVLWQALQGGKKDAIKDALEKGGDPNMTVPEGNVPALCWAAGQYYGYDTLARVTLLLEAGADLNKTDSNGDTPLMLAIRRGNSDAVKLMLEKGADPLHANKNGQTPLAYAIGNKSWHVATAMLTPEVLESLPVPAAGDRDTMQVLTLLRTAIENGAYTSFISPLLDKVPDLSIGATEGYSLAHTAAARGNGPALEALMQRADFDIGVVLRGGRGLLHTALGNREFDIAQTLVSKGADVMATDNSGRTVLEVAAQNGSIPLTNVILRKMREKTGDEKIDQEVMNRALLAAAVQGHARVCDILLKAGADKNAVNSKGETPLIAAAREGHLEVAKLLVVKYEVDTQTADDAGMIPYDHAVQQKAKGQAEMADYLICFQPGYEPPPPPPPPVDHSRFAKVSDYSIDVKEKGLTMTFNFWTQQVIYRDADAKPSPLSVVRFDDIPRQDAITEARDMLQRLGGRPPEYTAGAGVKKPSGISRPGG